MIKKEIRYITMGVAFVAVVFASCSQFQEEDLFEESAALRIEHNADKLQKILVNAPQGWVMQYYTGRGVSVFEGFNIFAKFDKSGKVTLAGNHRFLRDGNAGKYTEASSLYELIREDGLVLAFNTWNDVLTPFVDPVAFWAAPKNLYKDGAGMEGDQNLVVTSMNENEILFRGERYDAKIRMLKADRDWQTYINDTEEMRARFINYDDSISSYYITTGDTTMYCVGLRYGRYRFSELLEGYLKNDSLSCCFTPYGFCNERPDTINGHVFQEFRLNEDGSALVNEDGTVKIVGTWDTYLANMEKVMWIDLESLPENIKTLYTQFEEALKTIKSTYVLQRMGIGRSQTTDGKFSVTGLVVEWKPTKRGAETGRGGLAFERIVPTMGQMTITCSEDANVDLEWLRKKMSNDTRNTELAGYGWEEDVVNQKIATVEEALRNMGTAFVGTYNMTSNSNFVPTSVLFQAVDEGRSFRIEAGN